MAEIYKSKSGQDAIERAYRDTLQRWPVPNRQFTVPTRHGDTFVIESGAPNAPPLVLFHGSGTNSSAWLSDVSAWAQRHHVYAIDLIGEPGLSAPSRPPFGSDAYAEWLDDVCSSRIWRTKGTFFRDRPSRLRSFYEPRRRRPHH